MAHPRFIRSTVTLLTLMSVAWAPAAWSKEANSCLTQLSAADLRALGDSKKPTLQALRAAQEYLQLKALQLQVVFRQASGQALSPTQRTLLASAPATAVADMKLLLTHGAAADRQGRLSLAGFRFEELRAGKNSELAAAFVRIFPSAHGKLAEITRPSRKVTLFIEGQALLPPALTQAEPRQKYTPAMPMEAYQAVVKDELAGLEANFQELLAQSRNGGTFSDLVNEVSAFYTNDVWNLPAWERSHEAAQRAASGMASARLMRLKNKWGLSREQLDLALQAYSRVHAQAGTNREEAVTDLAAKALALALAPAVVPVAASGLLPALGTGLALTAADIAAGTAIEHAYRGGDLACQLLTQIDRKLAPGFTMSLLFAPAGVLGKGVTAESALVRTGSKVALGGLASVGAKGAVQSAQEAVALHGAASEAKRTVGAQAPLTQALNAEAAEAAAHAATDTLFAALGIKELKLKELKPQRPAGPAPKAEALAPRPRRGTGILPSASTQGTAASVTLPGQPGGKPYSSLSAAEKKALLRTVLDSSRELLTEHGTVVLPEDPQRPDILIVKPDKNGSDLNAIAWKADDLYGTEIIFDPLRLLEAKIDAYFNSETNAISLSFDEVLNGKRSDNLKHEVIHLVRSDNIELPLSGRIKYAREKSDPSIPYGERMSFQEVITHTWDLTSIAQRLARRMDPLLKKAFLDKSKMMLQVSRQSAEALKGFKKALTQPGALDSEAKIDQALRLGHLSLEVPGLGLVSIPLKRGTAAKVVLAKSTGKTKRDQLIRLMDEQVNQELSLIRSLEGQVTVIRAMGEKGMGKAGLETITQLRAQIRLFDQNTLRLSSRTRSEFLHKADTAQKEIESIYRTPLEGKKPISLQEYEKVLSRVDQREDYARRVHEIFGDSNRSDCLAKSLKTLDSKLTTWIRETSHPLWLQQASQHEARAEELFQQLLRAQAKKQTTEANRLKKALQFEIDRVWEHLYAVDDEQRIERFTDQFEEWEAELSGVGIWL